MAFEHGLEQLERAVSRVRESSGSPRERLAAASAEIDSLGDTAAVPAGILTELADFRRRVGSPAAFQRLTDEECERESARISRWSEQLREVVTNGAIGDAGPGEIEHASKSPTR